MISLKFNVLHFHFIFIFILQAVMCLKSMDSYVRTDKEHPHESGCLYVGDIMISPNQRNGVISAKRWDGGVIPYEYEEGFLEEKIPLVEKAMQIYFNVTDGCIQFVKRTDQKDYIIFRSNLSQCTSFIGRNGIGSQDLYIGSWCKMKEVLHELFHVVGYSHEHTRLDRDDYVTILWDYMTEEGKIVYQKVVYPYNYDYGVPYDYESISHYSAYGYSKHGHVTLITKDPKYQDIVGKTEKLSEKDILKIKAMYGCE